MSREEHPFIPTLKRQFAEKKISRREFLRTATLLGVSATTAYLFADKLTGVSPLRAAQAADMPTGGTLRIAMPLGHMARSSLSS